MKARKSIKGHRWYNSSGGCSCGAVHNEEHPRTEAERMMAGRIAPDVMVGMGAPEAKDVIVFKMPGDPGFQPAKNIRRKVVPIDMQDTYADSTVMGKRRMRGGSAKSLWKKVMRKEPCHYCGGKGGTIDHVIPASLGGPTHPSNCVPACAACNNFRGCQSYEASKEFGWKGRPFAIERGDYVQEG